MQVRVYNFEDGMVLIENVKLIRIISKKYNIIIFKDYLPAVGNIEGRVEIETDNDKKVYDNINAYYINNSNKFDLLIEG